MMTAFAVKGGGAALEQLGSVQAVTILWTVDLDNWSWAAIARTLRPSLWSLQTHNPLPWVSFVPMTEPARGTTKAVPSTLGSEFRAAMNAGVFGYLNSIGSRFFILPTKECVATVISIVPRLLRIPFRFIAFPAKDDLGKFIHRRRRQIPPFQLQSQDKKEQPDAMIGQNDGFDDIVFSREEFHLRGV
jgi:hypothetical protein